LANATFIAAILKQVFIIYGWDSYNTLENKEDQTEQMNKVEILRKYITQDLAQQVSHSRPH